MYVCVTIDSPVVSSQIVLLQLISVIIVAAYLLKRSRIFPEILDGHVTIRTQVVLVLLFDALSV